MASGKVIHKMNNGEQGTGNGERATGNDRGSGFGVRQMTNDKGPMTSKEIAWATPAHSVPQALRHSVTCRRAA